MKRLLVLALCSLVLSVSAAPVEVDTCEWNAGANAYTGDKQLAVDQLTHLPKGTREKIKEMMREHKYSDKVTIYGDRIEGEHGYYGARISHMRFGWDKRCKEVNRSKWSSSATQTALVYTVDGYSIIDPSVCRNIAQIYPAPPPVTTASLPPLESVDPVHVPNILGPSFQDLLIFDPPGAGLPPEEPPVPRFDFPPITSGPPTIYPPVTVSPIPEPSTVVMFGAGLLVLILRSRKGKKQWTI